MNKQTQTKMFDFSDTDLDFCAGSKNKFPDVFKKMLANGYNNKVVSSVVIAGDQVTLNYGVNHGYVADRVLAINTAGLVGEFYIDSVTSNTLTITVPNAPPSIAGGFTTKVAPLGWGLVYEQAHIHIYKFKHIDETDMYARLCFQNATTTGNRNCIAVGIGRTVNLSTGVITDENCLSDLRSCATVAGATSNIRWDFSNSNLPTFNDYSYSQGLATFGKGIVVGSAYHFVGMYNLSTSANGFLVSGILPFSSEYQSINYPVLLCQNNGASTSAANAGQLSVVKCYLGLIECTFADSGNYPLIMNIANSNFLPASIDNFNTTMFMPLGVYTLTERQYLGHLLGGLFQGMYSSGTTGIPEKTATTSPSVSIDIGLNSKILIHSLNTNNATYTCWLATPVEEIKIV